MTPAQERELMMLAHDRGSALLFALLQQRQFEVTPGGIPEDQWAFNAIKVLANALADMTARTVDAEMRAAPITYVVPRTRP